jgi:hypothetical protein
MWRLCALCNPPFVLCRRLFKQFVSSRAKWSRHRRTWVASGVALGKQYANTNEDPYRVEAIIIVTIYSLAHWSDTNLTDYDSLRRTRAEQIDILSLYTVNLAVPHSQSRCSCPMVRDGWKPNDPIRHCAKYLNLNFKRRHATPVWAALRILHFMERWIRELTPTRVRPTKGTQQNTLTG